MQITQRLMKVNHSKIVDHILHKGLSASANTIKYSLYISPAFIHDI